MSRETGLIKLQLRLPCGHVVGSECIAVWLKANNSCPICRREFFPAQPRPDLEDGMMEGQEEEDQVEEEEEDEEEEADRLRRLEGVCQEYCSTQPVRPDHPNRSIDHSKSSAPIPFHPGLQQYIRT